MQLISQTCFSTPTYTYAIMNPARTWEGVSNYDRTLHGHGLGATLDENIGLHNCNH